MICALVNRFPSRHNDCFYWGTPMQFSRELRAADQQRANITARLAATPAPQKNADQFDALAEAFTVRQTSRPECSKGKAIGGLRANLAQAGGAN